MNRKNKIQARTRVKMYKAAIEAFTNHTKKAIWQTRYGLCTYFRAEYGMVDELSKRLVEIKTLRPKETDFEYWWPKGENEIRINFLKECLKLAERSAAYTKLLGMYKNGFSINDIYFDKPTYGLCHALLSASEKDIEQYPELMQQQPGDVGWWWDKHDPKPRVKALKKALKLIETKKSI